MGLLSKWRAFWQYTKSERLISSARYDEAIKVMGEVKNASETYPKIVLLKATAAHKVGLISLAIESYSLFLERYVAAISNANDRLYLELYAQYWRSQLNLKVGFDEHPSVSASELTAAERNATLVTKSEFPFS